MSTIGQTGGASAWISANPAFVLEGLGGDRGIDNRLDGSPGDTVAAQQMTATPVGSFQPAPGKKYDLLIKGGEVVDPSQSLRGRRDVAIHNSRIAAVEADIPAERAQQVLAADKRLVIPGLVDMHAHVYPLASGIGLPADELVPHSATTTYVSAVAVSYPA